MLLLMKSVCMLSFLILRLSLTLGSSISIIEEHVISVSMFDALIGLY